MGAQDGKSPDTTHDRVRGEVRGDETVETYRACVKDLKRSQLKISRGKASSEMIKDFPHVRTFGEIRRSETRLLPLNSHWLKPKKGRPRAATRAPE